MFIGMVKRHKLKQLTMAVSYISRSRQKYVLLTVKKLTFISSEANSFLILTIGGEALADISYRIYP